MRIQYVGVAAEVASSEQLTSLVFFFWRYDMDTERPSFIQMQVGDGPGEAVARRGTLETLG